MGRKHFIRSALIFFAMFVMAFSLIAYYPEISEGIKSGILACVNVVIPSLFLFMILSGVISGSEASLYLCRPLSPVLRRVFKLPPVLGAAVALSYIGGYPVGAKGVSELLYRGEITKKEAGRAMLFCCNASPAFVVLAVGATMLGSKGAGGLLLLAHIASSVAIGIISGLFIKAPPKSSKRLKFPPFGEVFLGSVNSSTTAMLSICAFVVIFSGLRGLISAAHIPEIICRYLPFLSPDLVSAAITGIFEVTAGCIYSAKAGGYAVFVLIPFLISFGGISIMLQCASFFKSGDFPFIKFLLARMLHGILTAVIVYPFLPLYLPGNPAASVFSSPVAYHTPNTPVITTLLLLTMSLVLLRISNPQNAAVKKK